MSKPIILLAERDPELRRRLFAHLLCQGFDVIESSSMSEVFRALRQRRDIGLFIMSASLDKPGDGMEFAQLICRFGYAPRVILTSTTDTQERTSTAHQRRASASFVQSVSYEDILASVYRSL